MGKEWETRIRTAVVVSTTLPRNQEAVGLLSVTYKQMRGRRHLFCAGNVIGLNVRGALRPCKVLYGHDTINRIRSMSWFKTNYPEQDVDEFEFTHPTNPDDYLKFAGQKNEETAVSPKRAASVAPKAEKVIAGKIRKTTVPKLRSRDTISTSSLRPMLTRTASSSRNVTVPTLRSRTSSSSSASVPLTPKRGRSSSSQKSEITGPSLRSRNSSISMPPTPKRAGKTGSKDEISAPTLRPRISRTSSNSLPPTLKRDARSSSQEQINTPTLRPRNSLSSNSGPPTPKRNDSSLRKVPLPTKRAVPTPPALIRRTSSRNVKIASPGKRTAQTPPTHSRLVRRSSSRDVKKLEVAKPPRVRKLAVVWKKTSTKKGPNAAKKNVGQNASSSSVNNDAPAGYTLADLIVPRRAAACVASYRENRPMNQSKIVARDSQSPDAHLPCSSKQGVATSVKADKKKELELTLSASRKSAVAPRTPDSSTGNRLSRTALFKADATESDTPTAPTKKPKQAQQTTPRMAAGRTKVAEKRGKGSASSTILSTAARIMARVLPKRAASQGVSYSTTSAQLANSAKRVVRKVSAKKASPATPPRGDTSDEDDMPQLSPIVSILKRKSSFGGDEPSSSSRLMAPPALKKRVSWTQQILDQPLIDEDPVLKDEDVKLEEDDIREEDTNVEKEVVIDDADTPATPTGNLMEVVHNYADEAETGAHLVQAVPEDVVLKKDEPSSLIEQKPSIEPQLTTPILPVATPTLAQMTDRKETKRGRGRPPRSLDIPKKGGDVANGAPDGTPKSALKQARPRRLTADYVGTRAEGSADKKKKDVRVSESTEAGSSGSASGKRRGRPPKALPPTPDGASAALGGTPSSKAADVPIQQRPLISEPMSTNCRKRRTADEIVSDFVDYCRLAQSAQSSAGITKDNTVPKAVPKVAPSLVEVDKHVEPAFEPLTIPTSFKTPMPEFMKERMERKSWLTEFARSMPDGFYNRNRDGSLKKHPPKEGQKLVEKKTESETIPKPVQSKKDEEMVVNAQVVAQLVADPIEGNKELARLPAVQSEVKGGANPNVAIIEKDREEPVQLGSEQNEGGVVNKNASSVAPLVLENNREDGVNPIAPLVELNALVVENPLEEPVKLGSEQNEGGVVNKDVNSVAPLVIENNRDEGVNSFAPLVELNADEVSLLLGDGYPATSPAKIVASQLGKGQGDAKSAVGNNGTAQLSTPSVIAEKSPAKSSLADNSLVLPPASSIVERAEPNSDNSTPVKQSLGKRGRGRPPNSPSSRSGSSTPIKFGPPSASIAMRQMRTRFPYPSPMVLVPSGPSTVHPTANFVPIDNAMVRGERQVRPLNRDEVEMDNSVINLYATQGDGIIYPDLIRPPAPLISTAEGPYLRDVRTQLTRDIATVYDDGLCSPKRGSSNSSDQVDLSERRPAWHDTSRLQKILGIVNEINNRPQPF